MQRGREKIKKKKRRKLQQLKLSNKIMGKVHGVLYPLEDD